jgi:hypothetical protein
MFINLLETIAVITFAVALGAVAGVLWAVNLK